MLSILERERERERECKYGEQKIKGLKLYTREIVTKRSRGIHIRKITL